LFDGIKPLSHELAAGRPATENKCSGTHKLRLGFRST
jgi:hypothetical protein